MKWLNLMKRKWLFRALGLFFAGGICWLLVGVTINFPPKSPAQKLTEARALWQAKGIQNYQMDIVFGSFSYIGGFRLTVRGNHREISEFPPLYSNVTPTPLSDSEEKTFKSTYFAQKISSDLKQYSVDGLFDIAATKLSSDAPLVTWCSLNMAMPQFPDVRFNREYGYIESYDLGNCPKWETGGGLMCGVISDCNMGMRVRNFQVLPSSQ